MGWAAYLSIVFVIAFVIAFATGPGKLFVCEEPRRVFKIKLNVYFLHFRLHPLVLCQ